MKYLSLIFILISCSSHKIKFDSELSSFKYPFEVKTFLLKSQRQNLKMRYMDINESNSQKVVVLLHGKNFSGFYFERIAEDLIKSGYRVIIPDQIGFGKSSKPDHYQYSFKNLGLNTYKLLDHLKVKNFTLVGHSMGGMLSTHMSSMSDRVERLVLINPIGLEDYSKYVQFKDPEFFYNLEKSKTTEKFRAYQKKNYYDGKWSKEYEKLIVPFKGQRNGSDFKLVAWNNALTYSPIFAEEIVSILKTIKIPTYLILGTRDRTGPGRGWKKKGVKRKLGEYSKLGRTIRESNKNIKLYELRGLGHMPQFEDYKRFSIVFNNIMR